MTPLLSCCDLCPQELGGNATLLFYQSEEGNEVGAEYGARICTLREYSVTANNRSDSLLFYRFEHRNGVLVCSHLEGVGPM